MGAGDNKRFRPRHDVTVYGRFRFHGRAYDVPLKDLSETGCRFYDRHGSLQPDTAIALRIAGIGPFPATVRWRRDGYVGVEFDEALYAPVLDHIVAMSSGRI